MNAATREEKAALNGELGRRAAGNGAGPRLGITSSDSFDSSNGARPASWPQLGQAALHGLAGEVVCTLAPHTEADPVALLLTFLTMFGSVVGPGPRALVGPEPHPARLNVVLVGETSRGRKGTAQASMNSLFSVVEPRWFDEQVRSGLASGEGLIAQVADPDPLNPDAELVDKRLIVVEPEYGRVLTVAGRDGSTLSEIIRSAYDSGRLRVMTRHHPLRATGTHISVIGHVTLDELRRKLSSTDAANGFANRFLFALVRRSKLLPHGGRLDPAALDRLADQVRLAVDRSAGVQALRRSPEADAVWERVYLEWASEAPGGLAGDVTARPEAHALRLSVVYALLDGSPAIQAEHVEAAVAIWRYAEASAVVIFGETLGDDVADRLLEALRDAFPSGLDATKQYDLFSRNVTAERLREARALLERRGLAVTITQPKDGPGRPSIISYAIMANEVNESVYDVRESGSERTSGRCRRRWAAGAGPGGPRPVAANGRADQGRGGEADAGADHGGALAGVLAVDRPEHDLAGADEGVGPVGKVSAQRLLGAEHNRDGGRVRGAHGRLHLHRGFLSVPAPGW